jgi:hypothetical protein
MDFYFEYLRAENNKQVQMILQHIFADSLDNGVGGSFSFVGACIVFSNNLIIHPII